MPRNYVIQIPTSEDLYRRFYELHMQLRLRNRSGERWTLDKTLELLLNTYHAVQSKVRVY